MQTEEEHARTTIHELCRFGADFAGLPKIKPAKFRDSLTGPEKPVQCILIDELCRFAGLIPVGETQNTSKFHSVENNHGFVDNSWKSLVSALQEIKDMKQSGQQERGEQPSLLLSIPEVARSLRLSRAKVYRLIYSEGLPVLHFGRAARVSVVALQQWIAQREQSA